MRSWHLDRAGSAGHLDLSRATGLMSAIGSQDAHALAGEILGLLGDVAAVSQCTLFAYESGNRPRTLSVADHRGGRFLHTVADIYTRHFYALDGNQTIILAAPARPAASTLLLHQQTGDEIAHAGYRDACYRHPGVSDRISVLLQPDQDVWLSINLYRDRSKGPFSTPEIALIEAFAPLIAHAARHHYSLCGRQPASIPRLMLTRVRALCPDLSKRELDAVCGILEGRTAHEIADLMGIKPSSVTTYQKRAYRRLGISSQRELFMLCLAPGTN